MFAQPPDFLKLLAHELRWKLLTALSRSDHRVQELVELLGQPMNLVSYHLKQLRSQQLVSERRSSADGRDVYYSLDFEVLRACYLAAGAALHPALAADHGSTLDSSDDSTLPPASCGTWARATWRPSAPGTSHLRCIPTRSMRSGR
jgi:DNA-binding transcriptional ArsR family regulator